MPAARGVKRAASKTAASAASSASSAPKNKKKRGAIHLEIPTAPRKRGRVFTCGQGDVGQLGLGEDVPETTKFKHVTALGDKIVAVTAGGMHTVALDSSGNVWTYGCNDEGALGRNTASDTDEGTPKKVSLPAKAVAITAGDSHSAALLENGDVYAWGSFRDSHGSMGLVLRGREGKASKEPLKIDIGETAADIASGGDHLVILSSTGFVYTMGCGEQGQLGRLSQRSASRDARQGFSALLVPSKVTLKAGASRVWAGYHATFVLDASQEKVFAFGLNNYGQLGITGEKRKTALYAPTECDAFRQSSNWQQVTAGQHHSLALDSAGLVYAVGRCEYGRLGLGERTGDAETLEPVPKLQDKKCVSIAAGTSNSFAVTDAGEVFSWGMGSEGQLGTGKSSDADVPTAGVCVALGAHRPVSVGAGGQHTVLLVEDPNPQKEPSPAPESEPAEEKVEATTEEEEEEEVEEKKPRKRQRKEQEAEVTSTSAQAGNSQPQKVNGDEKKSSPMDVDQTDNTNTDSQDKKIDTDDKMDTAEPDKLETTDSSSQDTVESEPKSDSQDSKTQDSKTQDSKTQDSKTQDSKTQDSKTQDSKTQDSKTQDSKSQDSKTQDSKTQDSITQDSEDSKSTDIEMKPELNGESEKVEVKSVEVTNKPITTIA